MKKILATLGIFALAVGASAQPGAAVEASAAQAAAGTAGAPFYISPRRLGPISGTPLTTNIVISIGDTNWIRSLTGSGTNTTFFALATNTPAITVESNLVVIKATNRLAATGNFTDYGKFVFGTNYTFSGVGADMLVPNNFQLRDAVGNLVWFGPSHTFSSTLRPFMLFSSTAGDIVANSFLQDGVYQWGVSGGGGTLYQQHVVVQYNGTNNSHPLELRVSGRNNGGIFGRKPVGSADSDVSGPVEYAFYSVAPTQTTNAAKRDAFLSGGNLVMEMLTNAFRINGHLVTSKSYSTSTNISIDFAGDSRLVVTPAETNLGVSFTGQKDYTTNVYHKTLVIYSGAISNFIVWPSGIKVFSESGSGILPTGLSPGQTLYVRFESIGIGDTNVYAWASMNTSAILYDPDALALFDAIGGVSAQYTNGYNNFVLAMKANNLWSKYDFIYPFIGGTDATDNGFNGKNTATFAMSWVNAPTFTTDGVTGNVGSQMSGNTGWNPTTHAAQNAIHVVVYNRTQSPTVSGYLFGAANAAGTGRVNIFQNAGASAQIGTINDQNLGNIIGSGGDARGFLGISRLSANVFWGIKGSTITTVAQSSQGLCNDTLQLLARNFEGSSPDNWSDANISFFGGGDGLDTGDLNLSRILVEQLQVSLGRSVH